MLAHRPFAVFIGTIVSEAPTRSETQVRTEGHQRGEGVNLRFSSFVPRFITKQVKANGGSVLRESRGQELLYEITKYNSNV